MWTWLCPYCQPSCLPVSGRSVWRRPHLHFPACLCSSWSRPPKPATFVRFLSLFLWNVSILSFLLSLLSLTLRSCPLASFLGFQNYSCYTSSQKALSWPERTIAGTTALSPVYHLSPRPTKIWFFPSSLNISLQTASTVSFSLLFDPDIAPKLH